jgi:hypothetical protein
MNWLKFSSCRWRIVLLFSLAAVGGWSWQIRRQLQAVRFPAVPALCSETLAAPSGNANCPAYQPGEQLNYRISWEKIVVAGTAQMVVKSRHNLYEFSLKAQSSPALGALCNMTGEFSSVYDTANGAPIQFEKKFLLNKKNVSEIVVFNQSAGRVHWQSLKNEPRDFSVETGTQDPLSSVYSLRSLALKPGMQLFFPLLDGGRKYLLRVRVVDREMVSVSMGSFQTVRLEVDWQLDGLLVSGKKVTVWLTEDSRKLPVLASVVLPIGTGLIELTSFS